MPIILNQVLYNKAKQEANEIYKKPSAYKSGWIVKRYKELGGKYADDNKPKPLKRWFQEKWQDIGGLEMNGEGVPPYPVFRPTKRISKETPLLPSEINPENLKKQIELKQKIRGEKNLPPFI